MMDFKLILDAKAVIAETPIWDDRINRLYWTDLTKGDVHRFDPETGADEVWPTLQPIGGVLLTNDVNRVLCAVESGLYLLDLTSGMLDFILCPEKRTGYKLNDTRVDARGRIFTSSVTKYFGTPKHTPDMLGAFYMIDTDNSVKTLVTGITQYNGIAWNSDNTKMYVIDSEEQKLMVFDYDIEKGPVSDVREAADLSSIGMPDGICMDKNDNLYICHWSKKMSVWNKDICLKELIDFPVEYLCCPGFGGKNMETLFIATSLYNYDETALKANKGAGGLFAASISVRGCMQNRYIIHE